MSRRVACLPRASWLMRMRLRLINRRFEKSLIRPGRMSAEMISGDDHMAQKAMCVRCYDSDRPKSPRISMSGSFQAPKFVFIAYQ